MSDLIDRQPEKRTIERTETHACDYISRQVAIDAIDEINAEVEDGYGFDYAKWRAHFCEMPPAQPDVTDTNVGDMISRAAAIERIDEALARVFKEPCGELILRKVPSVQPTDADIQKMQDTVNKWFLPTCPKERRTDERSD